MSENLTERSSSIPAPAPPDATGSGAADEVARLRCEATLKTLAEVIGAGNRGEPTIAMRAYSGNCIAVAIGGVVDPAMLDRLRALLNDPRVAGSSCPEMVLDLSQVQDCTQGLATVLDQLREHRARDGCRLELRDPPPSLAEELDQASLTEAFTIFEAVHRSTATSAIPRPRHPADDPEGRR